MEAPSHLAGSPTPTVVASPNRFSKTDELAPAFPSTEQLSKLGATESQLSDILSWKSTRKSSIAFGTSLAVIFASQYVNVLYYVFWGLSITLAALAGVEFGWKTVFKTSLAASVGPKTNFAIQANTFYQAETYARRAVEYGVHELQELLFVRDLSRTALSSGALLVASQVVKYLSLWSLILLADIALFAGPLGKKKYLENKAVVDAQVAKIQAQLQQQFGGFIAAASKSFEETAGPLLSKVIPSRAKTHPAGPAKLD